MKNDLENTVRCCVSRQKNHRRKNLPKPPLKPMVVIDCCSKYLWAIPIRSKRTGPIALELFKLCSAEGYPSSSKLTIRGLAQNTATVDVGLEGGEYAVTIDEEVLAGGQYRVGHKRIEPLHLY
jgi:hypothetical protein